MWYMQAKFVQGMKIYIGFLEKREDNSHIRNTTCRIAIQEN